MGQEGGIKKQKAVKCFERRDYLSLLFKKTQHNHPNKSYYCPIMQSFQIGHFSFIIVYLDIIFLQ